jgi:hypothetical protein
MKALHDLGWLKERRKGKQLSITMDNCNGQNKNKYVLCLALYLVELNYFKVVELIFCIRGHTKNACDRLFNQLKKRWHKQQVFMMAQVCSCFFFNNYLCPLYSYQMLLPLIIIADGSNVELATTRYLH